MQTNDVQIEVSVLLPFYNAAATLKNCLDSIQSQSFRKFEVVAVNDNSNDDSEAVINKYSDERIRVIPNSGRGLVSALNTGLAYCSAPLVARMDADDIMMPERLEKQYSFMRSHHDVVLVASRAEKFPSKAIKKGYQEYMRWQNAVINNEDIHNQIYIESPFAHPSVMFRRDSVIAAGAYREGNFPEDYELWLRLHATGHRMEKLPEVLLRWRESQQRLSRVSPTYAQDAFTRVRIDYLAMDPRLQNRSLVFWGAGRKTRQRVQRLVDKGFKPVGWIDVDPKKIGKQYHGAKVHEPGWLNREEKPLVLNFLTGHGTRELCRKYLDELGYVLGEDYLEVG